MDVKTLKANIDELARLEKKLESARNTMNSEILRAKSKFQAIQTEYNRVASEIKGGIVTEAVCKTNKRRYRSLAHITPQIIRDERAKGLSMKDIARNFDVHETLLYAKLTKEKVEANV